MELTRKQEEGLKIAVQRYRDGEPYTIVAGYAGTGKSTLVQFIVSALDFDPYSVAYIAYTGKAAQVLRKKGCPNAMTAHRLLYKSHEKEDGSFIHVPKQEIGEYKMIVVDEVSMLPQKMWDLLLSHHIYVIACGDPGQLPPIGEETTVLEEPHIFLDEIMRQAADSEIIRLSADIRERKPLKPFKGTEVNIVTKDQFVDGMMTWADQVICGKNDTRYSLNAYYRRMKWGTDIDLSAPLVGDKVSCRKNNWEKVTQAGDALVNGTIGELTRVYKRPDHLLGTKCYIDFQPDTDPVYDPTGWELDTEFHKLSVDYKLLTTGEPLITKENYHMFPKWLRPEQFEYGYAITTHKAQGSEYDKVLVLEEMLKATDHARWLYTAVTRASKRLTLVMK